MARRPTPYYDDGMVTIYHGDCLRMPWLFAAADVLVTDPPYGIGWTTTGFNQWTGGRTPDVEGIANDGDTRVRDEVLNVWGGVRPALMFGAPMLAPPQGTKQVLVWHKHLPGGFAGAVAGWFRNWEAIYVLGRWGTMPAKRDSIIRLSEHQQSSTNETKHPHAKPVALMRELLTTCPPGVILDPFMGSGSTLRAAKDLGRRVIGVELDERHCEMAVRRLGQEVLF